LHFEVRSGFEIFFATKEVHRKGDKGKVIEDNRIYWKENKKGIGLCGLGGAWCIHVAAGIVDGWRGGWRWWMMGAWLVWVGGWSGSKIQTSNKSAVKKIRKKGKEKSKGDWGRVWKVWRREE
jgi:hypothetical protein